MRWSPGTACNATREKSLSSAGCSRRYLAYLYQAAPACSHVDGIKHLALHAELAKHISRLESQVGPHGEPKAGPVERDLQSTIIGGRGGAICPRIPTDWIASQFNESAPW